MVAGTDRASGLLNRLLALGGAALVLSIVGIAHVIALIGHPEGEMYEFWVEGTVGSPVFALLGALVLWRDPANRVGRLFSIVAVGASLQLLCGQYTTNGLPATWAAVDVTAALATLLQISVVTGFLFLILIFPTGRLVSPRWRPVAYLGGLGLGLGAVANTLRAGPIENHPLVRNPWGVEGADRLVLVAEAVGGYITVLAYVGAIASLIVRYRRARGDERLQVKWFAFGTIVAFLVIMFGNVLVPTDAEGAYGTFVWTAGPLMIPIAAAIAILRYRLYDIDVVVNKTLVYLFISGVLVLTYLAVVFVLQELLSEHTSESDLAIAGSTLVVAGLFRPLRSRIQAFVDRRFYRSRYDARRTLEEFSSHLRDEVDLDTLTLELVGVVSHTMQPSHASVWLRAPTQMKTS